MGNILRLMLATSILSGIPGDIIPNARIDYSWITPLVVQHFWSQHISSIKSIIMGRGSSMHYLHYCGRTLCSLTRIFCEVCV